MFDWLRAAVYAAVRHYAYSVFFLCKLSNSSAARDKQWGYTEYVTQYVIETNQIQGFCIFYDWEQGRRNSGGTRGPKKCPFSPKKCPFSLLLSALLKSAPCPSDLPAPLCVCVCVCVYLCVSVRAGVWVLYKRVCAGVYIACVQHACNAIYKRHWLHLCSVAIR